VATSTLVVDDSPVVQRTTAFTLTRGGHTVVGAPVGCEALTCLDRTTVDLAIVDLSLPGMDGLTLIHTLRAEKRCQHLPSIMLTASGQGQDKSRAEAEGVDAFLTKPTSSHELLSVTSRLLADADRVRPV
jgi:CheY-like chemotaxis protein